MKTRILMTFGLIAGFLSASLAGAEAYAHRHASTPRPSAWRLSFAATDRDGAPEVYAENFARTPALAATDWGAVKELVAFCRDHKNGFEIKTNGGSWGYSILGPSYYVTYQINGEAAGGVWLGADTFDTAVLRGDAIDFLRSLPDQGSIGFRVTDSFGHDHDATFRLQGVAGARQLIARACGRV
jgi:hypothetical protein